MSTLATIILAAGQGTRMKSSLPKVLHALLGRPMVHWPIQLSLELKSEPTILVVGHQNAAVEASVEASFPGQVRFALQKEQRGTGHAVMQAISAVPDSAEHVLILYGDVPLLEAQTVAKLFEAARARTAPLAFITTTLKNPTGYGRVVRDPKTGDVTKIVEEKDASPEVRRIAEINAGIYVVEARFLRENLGRLTENNAQGEYYLTDLVALAIAAHHPVATYEVADPNEVEGINSRAQLASLSAALRKRIAARLSAEGVTVVDENTTYIAPSVEIGQDTIIEAGVHLRGRTSIGARCHIDAGAILTDAKIADDVRILPYSVIEQAEVHPGAIIGPFSRLRPGAEIMENGHVGNFVELKKTRLGKGSKANHLAYLGDTEIGEGANIGAGTITCNYDGFGKYTTQIGDGVFVGSNATLVAPLAIDKNAYIAAGSTITDPVHANDLAFGRARQSVKTGRAEDLRAAARERAAKAKKK
ncbi:MAG: bifunctional UDP-N-acetylglucosamine diphosphorylase/glucosamine-1-phosphate N-acetyltransferase GlmU [Deltaproteobacteria bacterium]|nr:bifunctional UDP-N-acetylglucosamine diphosphorylase/glucosamine-1-phosphate N-acetyltransferase GlmU [Deltaproteobacteria bacterium]